MGQRQPALAPLDGGDRGVLLCGHGGMPRLSFRLSRSWWSLMLVLVVVVVLVMVREGLDEASSGGGLARCGGFCGLVDLSA